MIKFIISQVALTSLTLGALKRHGVIILDTAKVKNDTLKLVLVKGIEAGESAAWWIEYGYDAGKKFIDQATTKK